jgi:hypothetical protein
MVEDDRAADLDLAHGQLPPVASRAVGVGEGSWDLGHPAVEKALDLGWAEPVAERLQPLGLVAGGEPVGQLSDGQTGLGRLPLGPLVAVEPHLGRIGEVAADLDEARAEVGVQDVEVVAGHGPIGLVEAEVDRLAVGVLAPLVSHEDLLDLLGSHDRHHPMAAPALGLLQVRADVVELAIIPAGTVGPLEAQQGNVVCLSEGRDRLAEAVADAFEQRRGRDLVAQVPRQERHHLPADLQVGDVGVEVDTV